MEEISQLAYFKTKRKGTRNQKQKSIKYNKNENNDELKINSINYQLYGK